MTPLEEIQRKEIERLQNENTALIAKNAEAIAEKDRQMADLNCQLSHFKGTNLEPATKQILEFFFDRADNVSSDHITQKFRLQTSVTDYHLDVLVKLKFIRQTSLSMNPTFLISSGGREFIIKNRV